MRMWTMTQIHFHFGIAGNKQTKNPLHTQEHVFIDR